MGALRRLKKAFVGERQTDRQTNTQTTDIAPSCHVAGTISDACQHYFYNHASGLHCRLITCFHLFLADLGNTLLYTLSIIY